MTVLASPAEPPTFEKIAQPSKPHESKLAQSKKKRSPPKGIDKSTLTLAEPRRVRDREHVRYVATHPCLFCGRQPPTPTIYALPKAEHLAARSVTSSPSLCAADIIARSIGTATKERGGKKLELIRCRRPARCGSRNAAVQSLLGDEAGIARSIANRSLL
jgi:hypothetical protein